MSLNVSEHQLFLQLLHNINLVLGSHQVSFPGREPELQQNMQAPYLHISPVFLSITLVDAPINTPIDKTAPVSTTTLLLLQILLQKQLSSMITGPACTGSKTPPIPAPPEI